jgi:hypothetical protein
MSKNDNYVQLLKRFEELKVRQVAGNIEHYYYMGEIYDEFVEANGTPKYGSRTVDTLVNDLMARDFFDSRISIDSAKRFMYWAKNTWDFFEDVAQLRAMASKGLTMSHARILFSIEKEEDISKVLEKAYGEDGRMVTCAELQSLATSLARLEAVDVVKSIEDTTPGSVAEAIPAPVKAEGIPVAAKPSDPPKDEKDEKPGKPEKAEKPEKTPKAAPSEPKVASPLKAVNQLETLVSKSVIALPDALIAIKEVGQRGFNSDKAEKKFKEAVANLKCSLRDAIEPYQALLEEIKDHEV